MAAKHCNCVWTLDGKSVEFRIGDIEFFIEVDENGEVDIATATGEEVTGYVPRIRRVPWRDKYPFGV